jgi:hypothetical protein
MPKFRDMTAWRQAELLMQPAFIRLIDNITKQLNESQWNGKYEDVPVWAESVSQSVRATVMELRAELATASGDRAAAIEQALEQLPAPFPGYYLCLTDQDQQVTFDLWQLCYQICFQNYQPDHDRSDAIAPEVEIETSLLDDTGEVDWNRLDDKAKQVVEQVFASLPTPIS